MTGYTYDGFDRVLETHYPQASGGQASATDYERLGYDAGGNVVSRRLRDGQMLYYGYDALGRRVADDLPDTNVAERDVAYTYDNLGALVRAQDTNGWYSAYGYDALGRVTAESSNVFGNAYQYDAGGRLARQQWQDGFFVDYDYDVTGNMTAVRENGATSGIGVLARYAYDDLGRRTGIVRGNGTTTSYGYDAASRLGSLAHDMAGTAYDVSYGYTYNTAGQIASTTRSNDAYAYAPVNRDETSTINGLNQATSVGNATLTYDARGNLTNPGGTAYTFDTRNQLYTDGTHLLYRGPGGLLGQEVWGPEQHAFDHARGQLATEFGYGNGGQFRRFVYGAGADEPLVWYEGAGTTDRRWLHADERGSIVAVSDASGTVTAVNTYDEHGVPGTGNVGRLQYTGQMWLPAVGLYDYKARMYAPKLGRFLQTDPIGYGDGMNWYGYVGGDPVNATDPSGLKCTNNKADCSDGWTVTRQDNPFGTSIRCDGNCDLSSLGPKPNLTDPRDQDPNSDIVVTRVRTRRTVPQNGKAHRYVASGQVQCGADEAFELIRSFSAPGAPYAEAGKHDLILTGNNPITQIVNEQNRTILNVTRPGHTFFPGTVAIAVGQSGSGAYIAIVGKGTTPKVLTNTIGGYVIFQSYIQQVRQICSDVHSGPSG